MGAGGRARFAKRLLAVVLLAFAVRLAFAFAVAAHDRPEGGVDADRYHDVAANLAAGDGYAFHPARATFGVAGTSDRVEPDAAHPPLHPALLAVADLFGFHSYDAHRVVACAVSAAAVAVTGLLGRRLLSPSVGLVAAVIAALHPLWFQHPGYLVAETTYELVVPLALLAAAVAVRDATPWRLLLAGGAIGLCILTRSEAVLLVAVLGVPVALCAGRGRRVRAAALVAAGVLAVAGPWVVRNRVEFGAFVLSTNGGVTLAGANCDDAYRGEGLGTFVGPCAFAAAAEVRAEMPGANQAQLTGELRARAVEFAGDHLSRLPVVAAARVGRMAGVFRIRHSMDFDVGVGADRSTQWVGYGTHVVLLAVAVAGAVHVRRRRDGRAAIVLAAGPVLAILTAVVVYGATRIRVAAQPSLVLLAAAGATMAWQRWRGRTWPPGVEP